MSSRLGPLFDRAAQSLYCVCIAEGKDVTRRGCQLVVEPLSQRPFSRTGLFGPLATRLFLSVFVDVHRWNRLLSHVKEKIFRVPKYLD